MRWRVPVPLLSTAVAAALALAPVSARADTAHGPTAAAETASRGFADLYRDPDGPINGSTYIFNPVANFEDRMAFDFARMRNAFDINVIGFYNLVHLTDRQRDAIFNYLAENRQKAVVRIENYDAASFDFDNGDDTHADARQVISHYNTDDPAHGYTALLDYLIKKDRLKQIAYFAVNMPVDDPTVARHFETPEYPDGRKNPAWRSSQVAYADDLITRLRGVLGGPEVAKLYLSVFYGWDQSYETPSYADIAHPADGYFFNNYSYPESTPPDEHADTSTRINRARLQRAMDRLVGQYPTQPKVIEYGFHTVEYNRGGMPGQTAGLVATLAAKKLAIQETNDYYRDGRSGDVPFNVRGTLYFAQNLYKEEGNPPSINDWTLDYPRTGQVEAEDDGAVQYRADGRIVGNLATPAPDASGGRAVTLRRDASVEFFNLAAASAVRLRHRGDGGTLTVSVNGAAPTEVRLAPSPTWRITAVNLQVPLQGSVRLLRGPGDASVTVDWLTVLANYEAELADRTAGAVYRDDQASQGGGVALGGPGRHVEFRKVAAGTRLVIRYAATTDRTLRLSAGGGRPQPVTLPATAGATTYAEVTVPVTVPAGATLRLAGTQHGDPVRLDHVRVDGRYEAESSGGLYNGGHAVAAPPASGGAVARSFDVVGASDVFNEIGPADRLTFRYSATRDASLTVIMNGNSYPLRFPATGGPARFAEVVLAVPIPAHTTVIAQRNAGDQAIGLSLDYLEVS